MDALYILGTGSEWNNNEIRYSLRSLEENTDIRRVVIVGSCPLWLKNVEHIPARDMGRNKIRNTIEKLRIASESGLLDGEFLRMNDDFYFNEPHSTFPLYARRRLHETVKKQQGGDNYYKTATRRTMELLNGAGFDNPWDYSVHFPLVMTAAKVLGVLEHFPPEETGAYLFGTMYVHLTSPDAKPTLRPDFKVWGWREEFALLPFISSDNVAAKQENFRRWITDRFPRPSHWER